jgi:hypothetical protein
VQRLLRAGRHPRAVPPRPGDRDAHRRRAARRRRAGGAR